MSQDGQPILALPSLPLTSIKLTYSIGGSILYYIYTDYGIGTDSTAGEICLLHQAEEGDVTEDSIQDDKAVVQKGRHCGLLITCFLDALGDDWALMLAVSGPKALLPEVQHSVTTKLQKKGCQDQCFPVVICFSPFT